MSDKTNPDGLTFDQWYTQCDNVVGDLCGFRLDDLPDGNSWDAWNDGVPPTEYATERLAESRFPF